VIRSSPKSSNIKSILIGARAFIKATRKDDPYIIYTTPMGEKNDTSSSISIQYNKFGDVFEKKNVDILPKYRPYDCTIDLQNGAQPPFGPIYNLL